MFDPKIGRRAFLQSVGVGLGAAAVWIPLRPGVARAGVNENSYEVLENGAGKFKIDIQGAPVASANVESITIEDLVIDEREMTTGADWDYRVYGPGDAHYGSITIRSRVGKDSRELYQWWLDCSQGKNIRKTISVICLKRDGSEARRWNILDAFPTRWDPGEYSPSSNVAVETIVCKMGRVELAESSAPPPEPLPGARENKQKSWLVEVGPPGEKPFREADWDEVAGGGLLDPDREVKPADVCVPAAGVAIEPLVFRGPLTVRQWPCRIFADTLQRSEVPVNPRYRVALIDVDKRGEPVRTFNYLDCFPTRYVFPSFSASGTGNLYEEITIKPIRLELA